MKQIDLLAKVSSVIVAIVVIALFFKLENQRGNFYQYDDRKINLLQIKEIRGGIDYIITHKGDEYIELFQKHRLSLDEKNIHKVVSRLKEVYKSEYYSAELVAYMIFDDEKIELFHSKRYLKKVENYSVNEYLLKVLKSHGIDEYQYRNIETLKGKVFNDREKFLEEVTTVGKLKKDGWCEKNIPVLGLNENGIRFMNSIDIEDKERLLTEKEIEKIEDALFEALDKYESI